MSANVIFGGDLHLLPKFDHHQQSTFSNPARSASRLPLRSNIISSISRLRGRVRARVGARAATPSAFYAPTTQTSETFYDLLGVSKTGTLSDIKKAYKQLARKYHPDVSPPDRTEEYTKKFIMVHEAYKTLSDSQARASYDLDLSPESRLAYSCRRRSHSGETPAEEWRMRWQSQLDELRRKSMNKDSAGNASWGSRMRRRRNSIYDVGDIAAYA